MRSKLGSRSGGAIGPRDQSTGDYRLPLCFDGWVVALSSPNQPGSRRNLVLYITGLLAAGVCLYWTFREVDLARAWAAVALLGPTVLLTFLPYGFSVLLDGLGWSRLFVAFGRRVDAVRLLIIRISAEALVISLPGGILLAETLKPVLLKSRCGVPLPEGVSIIAARKCFIILGHGLYLGLATLLGWHFLADSSTRVLGVAGLPLFAACVAGGLMTLGIVSGWILGGGLAGRLGRALQRLPGRSLQRWMEARKASLEHADGLLGRALAPRNAALPALLYVGMWIAEATETFILLRLLGFEIGVGEALAIEAVLSVLKALAFFVPAGLGVQDAGYAAFIGGLGGSDSLHLAAAFAMVKRARELFWMLTGYGLLFLQARLRRPVDTPAVETP